MLDVVARRRAAMVFEGDFVQTVADRFAAPGTLLAVPFPEVAGAPRLVVGGDVAVAFRDSAAGRDLVEWLAGPDAFQSWADRAGYLSPNLGLPLTAYHDRSRPLAEQLRTAGPILFDLSDQLPGAFGGDDGQGMWRILQDFFAAVTSRTSTERAVETALTALARAARGAS